MKNILWVVFGLAISLSGCATKSRQKPTRFDAFAQFAIVPGISTIELKGHSIVVSGLHDSFSINPDILYSVSFRVIPLGFDENDKRSIDLVVSVFDEAINSLNSALWVWPENQKNRELLSANFTTALLNYLNKASESCGRGISYSALIETLLKEATEFQATCKILAEPPFPPDAAETSSFIRRNYIK